MPAATDRAIPTASCDVVDTKVQAKSAPVQLCMFSQPQTAFEAIERTARYASGPTEYLKATLGASTFEERKHMLHIPRMIDEDRYGKGDHRQAFEHFIACNVLGKHHGLFFLTGVQAQLAALKIHCEHASNPRTAWHISSHLESAEERAYDKLYNLQRTLIGNDPESLPTIDEIQQVLNLAPDRRPAALVIEVPNRTLGCQTYTLAELERISAACKEADVKLHCDGARIWEIEPYYQRTAGKSFADIARLFDTVYVSFYKGMRGATGAMLVSNNENLIKEAKVWQRRAGGNAFTLMYEVIDCERGFNENIGTFERKWDKMIDIVSQIQGPTEGFKMDSEKIVNFVPDKPTCCQIHTVFRGYTASELIIARDQVQETLNVRVFERLRPKESVDEKMRAERASRPASDVNAVKKHVNGQSVEHDDERHFMEWMIMVRARSEENTSDSPCANVSSYPLTECYREDRHTGIRRCLRGTVQGAYG